MSQQKEIFVGREFEVNQYKKMLQGEAEQWILFITGEAGIGKTYLLRYLEEKITPEDVAVIQVDFQKADANPVLLIDPLEVLSELADSANEYCDQERFQSFKDTLQREREQITNTSKRIGEKIKELEQHITDQAQLDQIRQELRFAEEKRRQDVLGIVTGVFFAQIDTLQKRQLVLTLDNYERLLKPGARLSMGHWLIDDLLPQLHDRVAQLDRECFVVIVSQKGLQSEVIQMRNQERFGLKPFDKAAVKKYLEEHLKNNNIEYKVDEAELQSIYNMTHGHPFYLWLFCKFWRGKGNNGNESQSMIEDEIAAFLDKRILDKLESPYKELTLYAVILRSFSLPELQQLFPDLLAEPEVDDTFNAFISYPYIEALDGYRYTYHVFVREALAKYTREKYPEQWRYYHERALELYEPYSPEWYHHKIAVNETEGMQIWQEAKRQAEIEGRYDDAAILLQVVGDERLGLSSEAERILHEEQEKTYNKGKGQAEEQQRTTNKENEQAEEAAASHTASEEVEIGQGGVEHTDEEAEEPQTEESRTEEGEVPDEEPDAAKKKAIIDGSRWRGLLPFLRRKPLRTAGTAVCIVIVILLVAFLLVPLLQANRSDPLQPGGGIGVTQLPDGEFIGVSDGRFAFDADCKTGNSLKCQASNALRQGDASEAESLWNKALKANRNDAEMQIYLEDQLVVNSPHVTFVVATTLTGPYASLGRDNLQGAYLAQGEYNAGFKLTNGRKVMLLIANFGSDPSKAGQVAQQIVQAANADKNIVGVMGFPLSAYVPQALAILQQAHLPIVSSGASSDTLSGISPYFFRVVPPDSVQAQVGANYALHVLHSRTAAVFYDSANASSKRLAKDFEQQFSNSGGFFREETYTSGRPDSLRNGLKVMEKNLPDLLYFAGFATDMNTVLMNLPSSSTLRIMGSDRLFQPQDYSIASRPGLTHVYFTAFAYPDEWNNLCQGTPQVCSLPHFFTDYSQVYDNTLASGTILSYDALSVLLVAYQSVISQGKNLQAALQAITGTQAFQGVSGQISFGAKGNPTNKVVVVLSFDPRSGVSLASVSTNGVRGCFLITLCSNP